MDSVVACLKSRIGGCRLNRSYSNFVKSLRDLAWGCSLFRAEFSSLILYATVFPNTILA